MSAHTPGPWHHWQPIGEEWVVTTTGPRPEMGAAYPHMPIRLADEIDREADARLMAAAPDLLATLEHVRDAFDENEDVDLERIETAIAKARGGK